MAPSSQDANRFIKALVMSPINLLLHPHSSDSVIRKKVALIIAPTYGGRSNHHGLVSTTEDGIAMKDLLEEFGYTVQALLEGDKTTNQPTYANIKQAIDTLVLEEDNVDYVLLYAGHSDQMDAKEGSKEEDGQMEFIIPCDALQPTSGDGDKPPFKDVVDREKVLLDTYLHEKLVRKIRKGCQLVAIFDSCHSGTLLNLKHHRCNRVGNLKSLLRRSSRRLILEPIQNHTRFSLARTETERSMTVPPNVSLCFPVPLVSRRSMRQCSGFCTRLPTWEKPPVICISASKDSQYTVEADEGGTLTTAIVDLFKRDRRATYEDIMITAQNSVTARRDQYMANIKKFYAAHKQEDPKSEAYQRHFAPFPSPRAWRAHQEALVSERCDPQLSSMRPLRMKATLAL